jgi:hypothetical protein
MSSPLTADEPYHYDAFVSYSIEDQAWVQDRLVPELEQAGLRVFASYRDARAGMPYIDSIEQAVEQSRHTIAVLTPAWVMNEWNAFAALQAHTRDPAALRRKLIPVLLQDCTLPKRITALVRIDMRDERRQPQQIRRLIRDIEDTATLPLPLTTPGQRNDPLAWWRWVYRYRRELRRGAAALVGATVLVLLLLQIGPFGPRKVWVPDPALDIPSPSALHNTGRTLLMGANNRQTGCALAHKGLWYRSLIPDASWRDSDVGDLICIEDYQPAPALSDIVALVSLPAAPDTIYALTSHSGVLLSGDAGAHFDPHPTPFPAMGADNRPTLLIVSGTPQDPLLWIASQKSGLWVHRAGRWARLDGEAHERCQGLPSPLTVRSLLAQANGVLIGTDRQGLWVSDSAGQSCRQVFDAAGQYEFWELADVSPAGHARFLALIFDWGLNANGPIGRWRLLDLCPRPVSCSGTEWQAETGQIWHGQADVVDMLAQPTPAGGYEWHLVTRFGQIWYGGLDGLRPGRLPDLRRCYWLCEDMRLAPAGDGRPPYLLAGHSVYQYDIGEWWRYWWS